MVLICVSLMNNDAELFFLCFLAICVSVFGEMSIQILRPFLSWVICLFIVEL